MGYFRVSLRKSVVYQLCVTKRIAKLRKKVPEKLLFNINIYVTVQINVTNDGFYRQNRQV